MYLQRDQFVSPIGAVLVVWDEHERLRAIDFEDFESRMHMLLARQVGEVPVTPGRLPSSIAAALDAYFAGEEAPLRALPVELGGTDFQRRVWRELETIASGHTTSYGALARAIGQPTASRAVGLANGANPIAIRIPCHRVIGANGRLTGYGGGLWRKEWLLRHESDPLLPL
jgi:methylated-DNA-[protein]-cysteine S-methyltransferase